MSGQFDLKHQLHFCIITQFRVYLLYYVLFKSLI